MSKQYFHYFKMSTLNKHVPSFNNQSITFTHMRSPFPLHCAIMIFMTITVHLCKPLCASLPKTEMSARPRKPGARLTNNRTERENICSQATFPCCVLFFIFLFFSAWRAKMSKENLKMSKCTSNL